MDNTKPAHPIVYSIHYRLKRSCILHFYYLIRRELSRLSPTDFSISEIFWRKTFPHSCLYLEADKLTRYLNTFLLDLLHTETVRKCEKRFEYTK